MFAKWKREWKKKIRDDSCHHILILFAHVVFSAFLNSYTFMACAPTKLIFQESKQKWEIINRQSVQKAMNENVDVRNDNNKKIVYISICKFEYVIVSGLCRLLINSSRPFFGRRCWSFIFTLVAVKFFFFIILSIFKEGLLFKCNLLRIIFATIFSLFAENRFYLIFFFR